MKRVPGNPRFPYGFTVGTPSDNNYPDVVRYAMFLAVNNDRSQVGLPPLRYTEFINVGNLLRGARDYWTPAKLAEKAKKQLRDPKTKRWITQRGSIPGQEHRAARARIGKDTTVGDDELNLSDILEPPTVKAKGPGVGKLGPPPKSSPTTKVTRLAPDAGIEAMVAAGHDRKVVEARYRDRGVIFQVDNPGRNPIHVFVANPQGMVQYRMGVQDDHVRAAEVALEAFQKDYAAKIAAGDPQALAMLKHRRIVVAQRKKLRDDQRLAAEQHYGNGGDETIGEMERLLAAEAAALHMEAISGWPAWKLLREDGTPLPFVLDFDESKLVQGEKYQKNIQLPMASIVNTIPGRAEDGNRIVLDRNIYRREMSTIPAGHFTKSDRETVGQHASAHEAGHLLDPRNEDDDPQLWDSDLPVFGKFVMLSRQIPGASSDYAHQSQREWQAEMHALASLDPKNLTPAQLVAVQGYLNLFMFQNAARPAQPSTAWIAANEQWLMAAYNAIRNGQQPPALPDPAKFFDIPKAKVYKNLKWKKPGEK